MLFLLDLGTFSVVGNGVVFVLELVSDSFKSVSLAFRPFANLLSGHLILDLLLAASLVQVVSLGLSAFAVAIALLGLSVTESAMGAIQAFVLVTLFQSIRHRLHKLNFILKLAVILLIRPFLGDQCPYQVTLHLKKRK